MSKLSAGRTDKFYRDSFILTLSNTVTGITAFIFSILLSRKLGAEGLGLYGLVMPVYGLLLCLTSEGLITAVSKITTICYSRGDFRNLYRTVGTAFIFAASWALCIFFLVLVLHNAVALHIVRDPRTSGAILALSPALVFVPLSAIIKGYFHGLGKFIITSSIDIIEKFLRVVILLGAVSISAPDDTGDTVAAACLALSAGELVSFLALFLCYRIYKTRIAGKNGKAKSRIQLMFDVLVVSVPLCANGILSSIISTASSLVLPRRIAAAGFTYGEALALAGRFGGMAMNISTLPYVVVSSMLTVLVPDLSLNISKKDYWSAGERIAQVFMTACRIGLSTALVCFMIPDTLGMVFYRRNDLGDMIRFSAPICLAVFASSPTFGILNALGRQNVLLKNSLINSLQNLVLIIALAGIPALNIYGFGISIIISSITSLVLNAREIKKVCEIRIDYRDVVVLLLSAVAAWVAAGVPANFPGRAAPPLRALGTAAACFLVVFAFDAVASWYRKNS